MDDVNCSGCGQPMEEGRAEVHNSPGTIFFKNLSLQDLYWYNKASKRSSRRRLVSSGEARAAFGCKACGLVTIDTTTPLTPRKRGRRR